MSNTIFITANWTTGALSQQTISRQYDNNRYAVQFIGYPEGDGTEELDLYLLVWMSTAPGQKPGEITPMQLNSDQWYISNYFTQQVQVIKFQLCVLNEAGTYEAHSPIFSGRIGDSLEHDGTSHDIDVSTLFDAYREYLNELIIRAGAVVIDPTPTQGSTNAVQSGGVYEALAEVDNSVNTIKSSLGSIDITWVDGFYIKETGEEKSYSIYSCTDYIPLYGEKIYLKTRVHQNATYLAVAFYDSEKTFISGVYNESATTQIFEGEVTIPENAVYARCSCWTSYIDSFSFELFDFIGDAIKKLSAVAELPEITADVAQNTADIAGNASDIAQNTADIGYLSDRLDGAENACVFTKIEKLQFSNGATNYNASTNYDTWYTPVTGGRHYHFAYTRGTKNVALRMAFAEQIPANQIPAMQVETETKITTGTYTLDFVPSTNGYFSATAYKNDIETGTMSMTEEITGIIPMISDVAKEAEQTRINGLKIAGKRNLYFAPESLAQNGTQVRMTSKTVIPHDDAEIYIICPEDICVWFELQKTPYDTTTVTTDYAGNGDSVKLSGGELYKAHFAYAEKTDGQYILTGETLLLADFVTLVESGKVLLLYQEESVIVNNKDSEKKLRALMGSGNAILSHTSDTHGDAIRYANFMEMSRHLGVTCAVNSGDAVNNHVGDGYTYLLSSIAKYPDVSTIFCIGNHDASPLNSIQYERFYKPFDDAYDYEMAQSNVYYYKDYADYNLRVISLDIYEERHNGFNCCISSTQINWLISTLASTPANYGVVIVAHSSENFVGKVTGYDKFYSDGINDDWTNRYSGTTGNPVSKIVDAFISRTTVSDSYEQTVLTEASGSTTTVETVAYSADFSNVPATVEFIAYLNGHKHKDMVGYLNGTTNKQLTLNVTHGCTSAYYANQDDFPRADGKGSVQDAFNIYAIDRTNKTVKIFRIGSNVKYDMTMRNYMVIPYAD